MIFSNDRGELRAMYATAWEKRLAGTPLSPLESQIADVIELHPEYHALLTAGDMQRDYAPADGETNPFLHMGLHLGLREQIATDRPTGIALIFKRVMAQSTDMHDAEHRMIECLAETLWQAQRDGTPPDEQRYLDRLQRLAN